MSRRGFNRGHPSQRRRSSWEEGTGGTSVNSFTASQSAFLGSALAISQDGLTLARTRGYVRAILTTSTGANDGFSGAIGIGIATTAAVTAGAASVPTPITEQDWEGWIWWNPFSVQSATSTLADGVNAIQR